MDRGNETFPRFIRPQPVSLWLLVCLVSEKHGNTAGFIFAYSSLKANKDNYFISQLLYFSAIYGK